MIDVKRHIASMPTVCPCGSTINGHDDLGKLMNNCMEAKLERRGLLQSLLILDDSIRGGERWPG